MLRFRPLGARMDFPFVRLATGDLDPRTQAWLQAVRTAGSDAPASHIAALDGWHRSLRSQGLLGRVWYHHTYLGNNLTAALIPQVHPSGSLPAAKNVGGFAAGAYTQANGIQGEGTSYLLAGFTDTDLPVVSSVGSWVTAVGATDQRNLFGVTNTRVTQGVGTAGSWTGRHLRAAFIAGHLQSNLGPVFVRRPNVDDGQLWGVTSGTFAIQGSNIGAYQNSAPSAIEFAHFNSGTSGSTARSDARMSGCLVTAGANESEFKTIVALWRTMQNAIGRPGWT